MSNIKFEGFDQTSEYLYALRTICEKYDLTQSDLIVFPYIAILDDEEEDCNFKHVRRIKPIPIKVPIPESMTEPNGDGFYYHLQYPTPDQDNPHLIRMKAAYLGLTEYAFKSPYKYEKQGTPIIRFWRWYGARDYYPVGMNVVIIEKKNYFEFSKGIRRLRRQIKKVDIPILNMSMLREIYDNSIGFFERAKKKKDKYQQYKIPFKRGILLCGTPGCGKCCNVKTLTFTNQGILPIGDFIGETTIGNADDCEIKIHGINGLEKTEQIYNGGFQSTIIITSRAGFEIEVTPNHKLITTDGETIQWKRADEIASGDYIAVPRNMNIFGSSLDVPFIYEKSTDRIKSTLPECMSEDLAYYMGLLTGDGNLSYNHRIGFSTAELGDVYQNLVIKLFSIPTKPKKDTRSKSIDYIFTCARVKNFLKALGMTNDTACNKNIPDSILIAPKNIVLAYLRGLFDTDGWADTTGRVGLDSCSENLIKHVQIILTNLGIISRRLKKPNNYSGSWALDMTGINARIFYNEIGFGIDRKNRKDLLSTNHHTNTDVIPYSADFLKLIIKESSPHNRAFHKKYYRYANSSHNMSITSAKEFISEIDNKSIQQKLQQLCRDDIYWDTVKSLEESAAHVADFYIPGTHSFAAGGFINHNTLTCKWLRQLCQKHRLEYKIVTMEMYNQALQHGQVRDLFRLEGRGLIFFDDMDHAVKSRTSGNTQIHNFLTALDGIEPSEGVVFVFTTNYMSELDEAFVRPGRVDVFMPFKKPDENLRRRFIEELFDEELKKCIDTDDFVKRTSDWTFAELEEIRKLLCLDLIDEKKIDVDKTFDIYKKHRTDFEERAKLGFGQQLENDVDYEDQNDGLVPW